MSAHPYHLAYRFFALSYSCEKNLSRVGKILEDKEIPLKRLRIIIAYIIGLFPFNSLRCFLYRVFFRYTIYKSRIDWHTTICVSDAFLDRCHINRGNSFIGPITVRILCNARIDRGNLFDCGWWVLEEEYKSAHYGRSLTIGEKTQIGPQHHFDVVGSLSIGDRCSIGGRGSQFWTHGAGVTDRDIVIGNDCYIGAGVLFSPGSTIRNNTVVALGSVVAGKFKKDNLLIGGVPAKIIRENYNWKSE